MISFLATWAKVVRFGYRQKHRSCVLFELPMNTPNYQKIDMMESFRQALSDATGNRFPDNHETYALM